jgi:hypothetical protein
MEVAVALPLEQGRISMSGEYFCVEYSSSS